jgi:carbon-monoxide dehydrogenase medium subunit
VIPAAFEYRAPESIDETLALLAKYREDAKVLAGGHSLIPALKLRFASPAVVIDLRRIPDLASIEATEAHGGGFEVGALVTHHEVETSPLIHARCPLLAETAAAIGDVQVRNFGTLVGSVCHADPSSDYPAALLALEAEVVIASPRGERSVPVHDFLQGMLETALEPDELARAVRFPASYAATAAYSKMRQSASGFAIAGAAAQLRLEGMRAVDVAVGITGVADRAFRATQVEEALRGAELTSDLVEAAVRGIAAGRELLGDLHASGEYRAHLAEVHARRAILRALSRA